MVCPNCRRSVSNRATFCSNCGAQINSSSPESNQESSILENSKLPLLMILGAAIIAIFAGVGFFNTAAGSRLNSVVEETGTISQPTNTAWPSNTPRPISTVRPANTSLPAIVEEPTSQPEDHRQVVPTEVIYSTNTPIPTRKIEPTNTAVATKQVVPTNTPKPTKKPLPTNTPRPTNTAVPNVLPTATSVPVQSTVQANFPGYQIIKLGDSVEGIPIETYKIGNGPNVILLIGGLNHGFAPSTTGVAEEMADYFAVLPHEVPSSISLYVVVIANPDSEYNPGQLEGRFNAHDVDLNRNWDCQWTRDATFRGGRIPGSGGSGPFSEPETQILRGLIEDIDPVAVVVWGAKVQGGLVSPGRCGGRSRASEDLARIYGRAAGYDVDDFERMTNQVINGDSTNWMALRGYPAITVLLPDYISSDWDNNKQGILALFDAYS